MFVPERLDPDIVPSTDKLAVPRPELAMVKVRSKALLKSRVRAAPVSGTFVSEIVKFENVQAPDIDSVAFIWATWLPSSTRATPPP